MTNTPATDPLAFARSIGLNQSTYSSEETFRDILHISHDVGWRLVKNGRLKATKVSSQKWVFTVAEIAAYLMAGNDKPPPRRQTTKQASEEGRKRAARPRNVLPDPGGVS